MSWTPESLFSYLDRTVKKNAIAKEYADPPMRGPSMIVEAYRHKYQDCRFCKTNEFVKPYNPGARGFKDGVRFKYECKQCGSKF